TVVTLIPEAAPFRRFSAWGDACTGTGVCTVAMTGDVSVSATFSGAVRLSLAVATPAGAVGQNGVGAIDGPQGPCDFEGTGDCTADLQAGTRVVLVATAAAGNRFLNWSGGPCNGRTNATCDFTLTTNTSTTALFRGVTGVRVLKSGNGTGTVTG